jgi:hypothetical protein
MEWRQKSIPKTWWDELNFREGLRVWKSHGPDKNPLKAPPFPHIHLHKSRFFLKNGRRG